MISQQDIFYKCDHGQSTITRNIRQSFVLSFNAMSVMPEDQQHRFNVLAQRWETATKNMSSIQGQIAHEDYIKIIAMGSLAIKFILDRMRVKPGFWFAALRALTEADPVLEHHRGDIHAMTEDWLNWGEKNAYSC